MGFSRQEYWIGLPFASPGDLSDPGIEPGSPALQADSLLTELRGKPLYRIIQSNYSVNSVNRSTWISLSKKTGFQFTIDWLQLPITCNVCLLSAIPVFYPLLLLVKHLDTVTTRLPATTRNYTKPYCHPPLQSKPTVFFQKLRQR